MRKILCKRIALFENKLDQITRVQQFAVVGLLNILDQITRVQQFTVIGV